MLCLSGDLNVEVHATGDAFSSADGSVTLDFAGTASRDRHLAGRVTGFFLFQPPGDGGRLVPRLYPTDGRPPLPPGTVYLTLTYDGVEADPVSFESVRGRVVVDAVDDGEGGALALAGSLTLDAETRDGAREIAIEGRFR